MEVRADDSAGVLKKFLGALTEAAAWLEAPYLFWKLWVDSRPLYDGDDNTGLHSVRVMDPTGNMISGSNHIQPMFQIKNDIGGLNEYEFKSCLTCASGKGHICWGCQKPVTHIVNLTEDCPYCWEQDIQEMINRPPEMDPHV